jgi:hypothetical protein
LRTFGQSVNGFEAWDARGFGEFVNINENIKLSVVKSPNFSQFSTQNPPKDTRNDAEQTTKVCCSSASETICRLKTLSVA